MPVSDWAFYFITDSRLTRRGVERDVEAALKGGARVVQYRNKEAPTSKMVDEAFRIHRLCRTYDADLIVNDRIDVALAVNAEGVHLGQSDMPLVMALQLMPDAIVGVSIGSLDELCAAESDGASYVAVSPVWATPTKEDAGAGLGTGFLAEVRKATRLHVTAIGGIKLDNLDEVLRAGADSVCAISATVGVDDTEAAVRGFEKRIRAGRAGR